MLITPIDHGLDLLKSDLVRSPGLHASTIFGDLFKELEPKRYDIRGADGEPEAPNYLLWALGTAWEKHLEYLLESNGVSAIRPDEFLSPEGIAYSPDLLVFNGVTRLGEIKYTSQSSKGYPTAPCNHMPPKADKYLCVAPEVELLTSDLRSVRAENVYVGMALLAFDESPNGGFKSKRHLKHTKVVAVKRISKPCARIFLSDGTDIMVSNDHQWYGKTSLSTPEQWMPTDGLLQTDKTWPGAPRKQNAHLSRVFPREMSSALTEYERGWLAGIADGEGNLCTTSRSGGLRLTLAQNPGTVLSEIERLLIRDGYKFSTVTNASNRNVSLCISDKQGIVRFLSTIRPRRLLQKFTELSLLPGLTYDSVQVLRREDMGEQWVYAIETESHTYIADGLASHNCQMMLYAYWLDLRDGWLAIVFNHQPWNPELRIFEITWTERELSDNHQMLMQFAKHKGLL